MEEERRLAFVALTRAEKRLYLSEAEGRTHTGAPRYPSRFLLDIDGELLDMENPPSEDLIAAAREHIGEKDSLLPENLDASVLPAGTRVRHAVFGEGTVQGFDRGQNAHIVQFDGLSTPRKLALRAKLERI
jgi:DNA helicase-2/ATP-dependent DNA helicase PcrA